MNAIDEAVGNRTVASADHASEMVETIRGGEQLIADAQGEYEAATVEKSATEIHVSELQRQVRAIDKAQKESGSRLLTSELRDVERQLDASNTVIDAAHAAAKRGETLVVEPREHEEEDEGEEAPGS